MDHALERLQRGLEQLYRLDPAPAIGAFLVGSQPDEANASEGDAAVTRPATERPEQLLVVEDDDLFVGVMIDTAVLSRLADDLLVDHNLEPFALVVEGVSHFLFVIHRARQEQPTTILELELQAEVDKYVAGLLLAARCPSLPSERLRRRLYDGYRLRQGLSAAEVWRYHQANALARCYARRLEQRFFLRRRLAAMLGELRRFYRMSYRAKRELIQRAA